MYIVYYFLMILNNKPAIPIAAIIESMDGSDAGDGNTLNAYEGAVVTNIAKDVNDNVFNSDII